MKSTNLIITLLFLLLGSCSKETFTSQTQQSSMTVASAKSFQSLSCGNSTIIKPKVDILYIIDNSSSATYYLPNTLKQSILNTLYQISDNYDYHIYIAPLMANRTNGADTQVSAYPIITNNRENLPVSLNYTLPENINFFASVSTGAQELGFSRVYELITNNMGNGIFRPNANTIVVLVSNGDDTDYTIGTQGTYNSNDITYWYDRLMRLTNRFEVENPSLVSSNPHHLRSTNFRFLSLVAHSACSGYNVGSRYLKMSSQLYDYNRGAPFSGMIHDSFNMCSGNFSAIYEEVSQAIQVQVLPHIYNYWPVQQNVSTLTIDPAQVMVTKIKSDGSPEVVPQNAVNGFTLDTNYHSNFNIRLSPVVSALFPAENYSGFFIQLNGTATVTYPECLIVRTQNPQDFYRYYMIPTEPDIAQTQIIKNGVTLTQSTTNGWEYLGYVNSMNIKIKSKTDTTPYTPGEFKSGYTFRFNGTAIYTNEDTIQVLFKPKSL